MTLALILSTGLAIIFIALYFTERENWKQEKKLFLDRLPGLLDEKIAPLLKVKQPSPRKELFKGPLTPDGAEEAVRLCGIIPERDGNDVLFNVKNKRFNLMAGNVPYVSLWCSYNIEEYDEIWKEAGRQACNILNGRSGMGKVAIHEDNKSLSFVVYLYETEVDHLKDSLWFYIDTIESLLSSWGETQEKCLENMKKETEPINQNDLNTLIQSAIQQEGNKKVVS